MSIVKHFLSDSYEFNGDLGAYRKIGKQNWMLGSTNSRDSYLRGIIRYTTGIRKTYRMNRLIWESFNGPIPDGYVIDHIDNNPINNKISNLQCITPQANNKRRDNSFLKNIIRKKGDPPIKKVKAIYPDGKTEVYISKSCAGKIHGCSAGLIYMIIGRKKGCVSHNGVKFEYTDEEPTVIVPRKIKENKYTDEQKKEKQKQYNKKYLEKKKLEKLNTIEVVG